MAQDNLSFSWELRGTVEKQIKEAVKDADKLKKTVRVESFKFVIITRLLER